MANVGDIVSAVLLAGQNAQLRAAGVGQTGLEGQRLAQAAVDL